MNIFYRVSEENGKFIASVQKKEGYGGFKWYRIMRPVGGKLIGSWDSKEEALAACNWHREKISSLMKAYSGEGGVNASIEYERDRLCAYMFEFRYKSTDYRITTVQKSEEKAVKHASRLLGGMGFPVPASKLLQVVLKANSTRSEGHTTISVGDCLVYHTDVIKFQQELNVTRHGYTELEVKRSNEIVTAAYMWQGAQPTFAHSEWEGGQMEFVRLVTSFAPLLETIFTEQEGDGDGDGVWYYDVAEPFGKAVAEFILRHLREPTESEARELALPLVRRFFKD